MEQEWIVFVNIFSFSFFILFFIAIRGRQVQVLCGSDECNVGDGQPGDSSYQRSLKDGLVAQDEEIRAGEVRTGNEYQRSANYADFYERSKRLTKASP